MTQETRSDLRLDPTKTQLHVETRAKGMLAKLAHDLRIDAKEVAGTATLEAKAVRLELRAPVARLEVAGILKGNDVDRVGLSASDRSEIQRRIREDVLNAKDVVVTCEAALLSPLELGVAARCTVDATGRIEIGRGATSFNSRVQIDVTDRSVTASGRVKVNLPSLGVTPPKGPLGAFRVSEDVEVVYQIVLVSPTS